MKNIKNSFVIIGVLWLAAGVCSRPVSSSVQDRVFHFFESARHRLNPLVDRLGGVVERMEKARFLKKLQPGKLRKISEWASSLTATFGNDDNTGGQHTENVVSTMKGTKALMLEIAETLRALSQAERQREHNLLFSDHLLEVSQEAKYFALDIDHHIHNIADVVTELADDSADERTKEITQDVIHRKQREKIHFITVQYTELLKHLLKLLHESETVYRESVGT